MKALGIIGAPSTQYVYTSHQVLVKPPISFSNEVTRQEALTACYDWEFQISSWKRRQIIGLSCLSERRMALLRCSHGAGAETWIGVMVGEMPCYRGELIYTVDPAPDVGASTVLMHVER